MHRLTNPNLELLEVAVVHLGELIDQLVFLGGCATGLLITDNAAPPIRYTHDVDVITEVASLLEYYRLADRLREKGFMEDASEGAPICRWKMSDILLDVMPTDPEVFGFGSSWYQEALEGAMDFTLPSGHSIRMITAPYFIACKLAAFDSRGDGDYLMSHDMEDIVAVMDGRPELVSEVRKSTDALRQHLVERYQNLLDDVQFQDSLPGHMPSDAASQARVAIILARFKEVADLGEL